MSFILILLIAFPTSVHAEISFLGDEWIQIDDPSITGYDIYMIPSIKGYDENSSIIITYDSKTNLIFKWKKAEDSKTFLSFYLNNKLIERCNSDLWIDSSTPINVKAGDLLKWEFKSQRNKAVGAAWIAIPSDSSTENNNLKFEPSGNKIYNIKNKAIYLKGKYNLIHIISCKNLSINAVDRVEIKSNDNQGVIIENSENIKINDFYVKGGKIANIHIENSSFCELNNISFQNIFQYGLYIYNSSDIFLDSNKFYINDSNVMGISIENNYANITLANNYFYISGKRSIISISNPSVDKNNCVNICKNNIIISDGLNDNSIASVSEGNISCSIYNNNYCCGEDIKLKERSNNTWDILGSWECK